jgi:hypothetical protein
MWRLSTISAHVFPLSPPSAAEAANLVSTAEVTRRPLYLTEQITLPRQLEQDDSGALLPADVAMLERLEAQAVARREYRLAAHLRDMLTALVPHQQAFGRASGLPRRTLEDFAPPDGDPAIALRCFRTHGFVVLHGLLHGAALQRARDAWRRAEPSCHAEYEQREAAVAQGSQVEGEEGERPPASLAHLPLPSPCIISASRRGARRRAAAAARTRAHASARGGRSYFQ